MYNHQSCYRNTLARTIIWHYLWEANALATAKYIISRKGS